MERLTTQFLQVQNRVK